MFLYSFLGSYTFTYFFHHFQVGAHVHYQGKEKIKWDLSLSFLIICWLQAEFIALP